MHGSVGDNMEYGEMEGEKCFWLCIFKVAFCYLFLKLSNTTPYSQKVFPLFDLVGHNRVELLIFVLY